MDRTNITSAGLKSAKGGLRNSIEADATSHYSHDPDNMTA